MLEDVWLHWKGFAVTFAAVFVAELGDKTQLATLGLTSVGGNRLTVFMAASSALVLATLIAVLLGGWLHARLDVRLVQRVAAALFLAIGGWLLWASFRAAEEAAPMSGPTATTPPSEG
jgi:putative Ca2+/H+ antiporter (TMEM165/GDT1 family)